MKPEFSEKYTTRQEGSATPETAEGIAQLEINKAFEADMTLARQCKYRPFYTASLGSRKLFTARNGLLIDIVEKLEALSKAMQKTMDYHCKQEKQQIIDGTWRVSASSFGSFNNSHSDDPIEIEGFKILKDLESQSEKSRRYKDMKAIDKDIAVGTANRRERERKRERVNPDLKKEQDTKAFEQFIAGQQPEIDRQKQEQAAAAEADRLNKEAAGASNPKMNDGGDLRRQRESLAVLGLSEGATTEETKGAYRRLASAHHPDRHESSTPEVKKAHEDQMVKINLAKQELGI